MTSLRVVKSLGLAAILIIIALALTSCVRRDEHRHQAGKQPSRVDSGVAMHRLQKLWITGDFDGDGNPDTLTQHCYSRKTGREIDSAIDPFGSEYDSVVDWFNRQEASLYLAFNAPGNDTIHTDDGSGLYCLLNIGDNNGDGKDEVALVVDHLDYSQLNSCKIYSYCGGTWQKLLQFGIHESAFDWPSDQAPEFQQINGYLEKRGGNWHYVDYDNDSFRESAEAGKMKTLRVPRCR